MQAIAKWLVAGPLNAALALVITLILPAPQLTSGAIMVLLVLAKGLRYAVMEAFVAAAVLVVMSLLLGGSLASIIGLTAGTWVPVLLLAVLLATTRSLTLTLQVSVIVAVAALLVFQVVVTDPEAFWQPTLKAMNEIFRESGLQLDTALLTAEVMTISAALVFWALNTVALLIGYALYQQSAEETVNCGRFRDLNFGRVIALTIALISVLSFAIGAAWLQNIAFMVFVMFTMQGLALLHFLRNEGKLPLIAVVSVYALLPFLQVLLVVVLALFGYTDAWIGFRRRWIKT